MKRGSYWTVEDFSVIKDEMELSGITQTLCLKPKSDLTLLRNLHLPAWLQIYHWQKQAEQVMAGLCDVCWLSSSLGCQQKSNPHYPNSASSDALWVIQSLNALIFPSFWDKRWKRIKQWGLCLWICLDCNSRQQLRSGSVIGFHHCFSS